MKIACLILLFISSLCSAQRTNFNEINFNKADSIARSLNSENLKNLPVLSHKLTKHLTTNVEKFRAIYTWVCTAIENDYHSYLRTSKKRRKFTNNSVALAEWNKDYAPKVIQKLVKEKKTSCTGYAFLIRELASLADINCKIVDGYGRTAAIKLANKSIANHSWNTVELNGKWYLCDATWSAGRVLLEEDGPRFEPNYFDGYFLGDPQLFIKNHYPLDLKWTLLKEPPTYDEYILGPLIYKEAFNQTIIPVLPTQMKFETIKNKPITFTLQTTEKIDSNVIQLQIDNGGGNKAIHPKINMHDCKLSLVYVFDKTGTFDVHIVVSNEIIATYVVRVKKR